MPQPSSSEELVNGEKQDARPGRAPPKKASESLVRRRLCRTWAMGYDPRPFYTFNGCGLLWRVRGYIAGNPLSIDSLCIRSHYQGGP